MIYQIENTTYDNNSGIITRNSEEFKLTKTQGNLLNYFLSNPRTIISKQKLMEDVWERIVTENSVDQIISILRNYLEDNPSEPHIIITHFGQGLSFEADAIPHNHNSALFPPARFSASRLKLWLALVSVLVIIFIAVIWIINDHSKEFTNPDFTSTNTDKSKPSESIKYKNILILPMTFADKSISDIEQTGMKSSLKSAFNTPDTEGNMIFDEASLTAQQAIEKHWRLQDDLLIMQSKIIKNGDVFEAIIELSDGVKIHKTTTLSANNINDLLNNQILFIDQFNQKNNPLSLSQLDKVSLSPDQKYIQALGYLKSGNILKSKELILQLLEEQEDNYLARLKLAEILYEENKMEKSLSELITLKSTSAYQFFPSEIELGIAKIKFSQHQYEPLIQDLTDYQITHPEINEIKKAKIQLQLGAAYLAQGNLQNAMKLYKQSIFNINQDLNPQIFAQSYYGQGKVLIANTVDEKVFALFEKSLKYAQLAGNVHFQILALNEMSSIALSNYHWDKTIAYTKQALSLLELNNDKYEIGLGLGNLVTVLNLRGQFTEAKQVNQRMSDIAKEINSSKLQLHYLHFSAILAMNNFEWLDAQHLIAQQLTLAQETNDYGMQLNNAFLALELILLKKDSDSFMPEWEQRSLLIKKLGFERFEIYMDYFLARYYILISQNNKAIELINQVSEKTLQINDFKLLVDAKNQLAIAYMNSQPKKSLEILNNLEQYNPHPNPYLDLKALALHKLGKHIEALSVLNQAKLVYHESWTTENQSLLEIIKNAIKDKP